MDLQIHIRNHSLDTFKLFQGVHMKETVLQVITVTFAEICIHTQCSLIMEDYKLLDNYSISTYGRPILRRDTFHTYA